MTTRSRSGSSKDDGEAAESGIATRRAAARAKGTEQYQQRRQEIVNVAAQVFRRQGFAQTSADDIARAVGVDRATFYYYARSTRELFDEIILQALLQNVEMAERYAESTDDPASRLSGLIVELLQSYIDQYPQLFVFLQENLDPTRVLGRDEVLLGDLQRRFDRALIAIVKDGVQSGAFRRDLSPRITAYGIIGMVNWTHRWLQPDGSFDVDVVGEELVNLAVRGLLNPHDERVER